MYLTCTTCSWKRGPVADADYAGELAHNHEARYADHAVEAHA